MPTRWIAFPYWKKVIVVLVSVLLVLGLAYIDGLTGIEVTFTVFYLAPIFLVTWYIGPPLGVLFAAGSTLLWLIADYRFHHPFSFVLVPFWNALVRIVFFLIVIYLLTTLKRRQQRKRELESLFFHDILNAATAIRGFSELLPSVPAEDREEISQQILRSAERIVEEIEAQRIVSAAENEELEVRPEELRSLDLLKDLAKLYSHHDSGRGKQVAIDPQAEDLTLAIDRVLLGRVLGNMIKNALEASQPGEPILLGCCRMDDQVEFRVQNKTMIPPELQGRVFSRSFSTKGQGRGLGTYSMQMLSRHLDGEVTFTSDQEEGTIFRARYPLRPRNS